MCTALEGQPVTDADWMHNGFQFMKTIRSLAEDVQQQINFARRIFLEAHGISRKQNAPTGICWRVQQNGFGHG
jgi:hypothetical protein